MGHELSMYFWGVSCIYGWVSTGYSETYHYMTSYCIAFHPIIHSWWLYVSFGVWKILNVDFLYWRDLNSECNIYIYILVQSKNLFSYITPVTTSSWSVNGTYWVHVVSYLYYTCCTLVVQIRFQVGAHLEEQFESEFGVSWSCGELLGCFVAHISLYLLPILLFSIQTGYPLC